MMLNMFFAIYYLHLVFRTTRSMAFEADQNYFSSFLDDSLFNQL